MFPLICAVNKEDIV